MKATAMLDQMTARKDLPCDLPETINYHFTPACNMRCAFCFAGFRDCGKASLDQYKAVIRAIAGAPSSGAVSRRLNFVGGEPTVDPFLDELLFEAHACGLRTSVVSNGFNLIRKGLPESFKTLELLGLSIDSLDPTTNRRIGRTVGNNAISIGDWFRLFEQAGAMGLPLKINTTVTAFNADEVLSAFIEKAAPRRWKVFQGMVVDGQNGDGSDAWAIDRHTFERFVRRNSTRNITPLAEPETAMRGSYAMISPDDRFFDSTVGGHSYSDPIVKVGVDRAWRQISFDSYLFQERTRSYQQEEVHKAA